MILKIRKVKNLGLFRDYRWDAALQDFTHFNLIYGWNGSGKTTLSRFFTALNFGVSDRYSLLEYEIEGDAGVFKSNSEYVENIRVFNKDYVQANVEKLDGPNPIYILGDGNKKLIEEITNDEQEVGNRKEALRNAKNHVVSLENQRDKLFTDIARTISQNISGESTRNYRKPNAETDFNGIKGKKLLSEEQVKLNIGTISQQQKPELDEIPHFDKDMVELESIVEKVTSLLNRK
ncbi:MAG: AAA family ATPase [Actinomycetota bacterium]